MTSNNPFLNKDNDKKIGRLHIKDDLERAAEDSVDNTRGFRPYTDDERVNAARTQPISNDDLIGIFEHADDDNDIDNTIGGGEDDNS